MNKKSFLDMVFEALVVLAAITCMYVFLIVVNAAIASEGDRKPAILTIAAEARDIEGTCRIPEALPPEPKRPAASSRTPQPAPEVCTSTVCKRVKAWMMPTPAPEAE